MTVATFPNRVDQQKSNRLRKQAQKFQAIQQSPAEEWAYLLFQQWPQALPVYVISRLLEQGHHSCVGEYLSLVSGRDHFKELDETVNDLKELLSDDTVLRLYQSLHANNPNAVAQVAPVCDFIASLPRPVSVTVSASDVPLVMALQETGVIDHQEESAMVYETHFRTSRFFIDDNWNDASQLCMEAVIVAGLVHRGGVQLRHPLPLRVQRANNQGVMEWVHQEKIYGFALQQGIFEALSVQDLNVAYCTGPHGEHLPLDVGTHVGNTIKDFELFQKRQQKNKHH